MKILVIHDRDEVVAELQTLFSSLSVSPEDVQVASDGLTARTLLRKFLFDFCILDLTIPHISGVGNPDYSEVSDLLQELFYTDDLNLPGDLLGLTKEVKALEAVDAEIGPHLMAIVEEDGEGLWKKQILDRLRYAVRAKGARIRSINQHYDYDVAIVTALDREMAPYKEIFDLHPIRYFQGAKEFLFKDSGGDTRRGVAFSIGRAGQAPAASWTQAVITQFRPAVCLMSGYCGGFAEKTKEGELLFAESVVDWDFGKWKGTGDSALFLPRPDPISIAGSRMHDVIREMSDLNFTRKSDMISGVLEKSKGRITEIKMKIGPISSGSSVVADPIIINRIQNLNENILGVDMESYGFYFSSKRTPVVKPQFLVVKAVADFCDRSKEDKDQEACSFLSAKIMEEILLYRWKF